MLASGNLTTGETFQPWTRDELRKLAGLNLLRVFEQVERVRDNMLATPPYEDIIPFAEFEKAGAADQLCMTDMNIHKE